MTPDSQTVTRAPARIGLVCDLREENWPSLDLVSEMLFEHLHRDYSDVLAVARICPPMRRRFTTRTSEVRSRNSNFSAWRFNADRVVNRFWDYPRAVRRIREEFDLFHVIDHSYGQLLHDLPPERTIVTCHDLDTFQCLLEPTKERRSFLFKKMVSRTLSGFRRAALVTCVSEATRDQLLAYDLVSPERAVVIPNGVHPSCCPEPNPSADAEAERLLGRSQKSEVRGERSEGRSAESESIEILHVGSTIPRKRIDVLLRVFARLKELFSEARLIRVGGAFTAEQLRLVEKLGLRESIVVLSHIDRNVLAAVYRRASLVLQPSEREGFGLPIVEAMACGTPVVASDLPVLREVGGNAALYCTMGDVEAWTEGVAKLLTERRRQPERWKHRQEKGLAQSAKFTWAEYTRGMVNTYDKVLAAP